MTEKFKPCPLPKCGGSGRKGCTGVICDLCNFTATVTDWEALPRVSSDDTLEIAQAFERLAARMETDGPFKDDFLRVRALASRLEQTAAPGIKSLWVNTLQITPLVSLKEPEEGILGWVKVAIHGVPSLPKEEVGDCKDCTVYTSSEGFPGYYLRQGHTPQPKEEVMQHVRRRRVALAQQRRDALKTAKVASYEIGQMMPPHHEGEPEDFFKQGVLDCLTAICESLDDLEKGK